MDRLPEKASSVFTVLGQRDPRWAQVHLGYADAGSDSTLGKYGCAITSLAMLLGFYGRYMTPVDVQNWMVENKGFRTDATRNLVNWTKLPVVFPEIRSVTRRDFVTRDPTEEEVMALQGQLNNGHPAILKVDGLPGSPALDEHFVLATHVLEKSIIVADPYTGQMKLLTDFCPTNKPWRKTERAAIWAILNFEMYAG